MSKSQRIVTPAEWSALRQKLDKALADIKQEFPQQDEHTCVFSDSPILKDVGVKHFCHMLRQLKYTHVVEQPHGQEVQVKINLRPPQTETKQRVPINQALTNARMDLDMRMLQLKAIEMSLLRMDADESYNMVENALAFKKQRAYKQNEQIAQKVHVAEAQFHVMTLEYQQKYGEVPYVSLE